MPLYNALVHTIHYSQYAPLRNLISSSASFVRSHGGAVRGIQFQGTRLLPAPMRSTADKALHDKADIWNMSFDTNPPTLQSLHARFRADPRVLRFTLLKQGEKFEEVIGATNPYTGITGQERTIEYPALPQERQ